MLAEIIKLDHQLFYAINSGLSNIFFDWLMPILRNRYTWVPLYIFIVFYFIKNYKLNGFYLTLTLFACFAFADFTSASLIKKAVKRPRPCNEITFKKQVIMRVNCGSGFSFPSTHATDHFAIALFIICVCIKKNKYISFALFSWAFLIAFAQIYVGVHFPLDVICGSIYGSLIGWAFAYFFNLKYKTLNIA
ncbi:MAG: phosphatase PAP2 family protein [Sphingobacteriales bacterium]|nr:MAG: phosphatase PAP2 family protein [Sphingobacteriales bacterium]